MLRTRVRSVNSCAQSVHCDSAEAAPVAGAHCGSAAAAPLASVPTLSSCEEESRKENLNSSLDIQFKHEND